jgi:hypothetical protein
VIIVSWDFEYLFLRVFSILAIIVVKNQPVIGLYELKDNKQN